MRGSRYSEPDGISAECFYMLGMYAGPDGMTAGELHAASVRVNAALREAAPTLGQVRSGLLSLARRRPPLAARVPGRRGRWGITADGWRMLRDEQITPARKPCGTGWPPTPQVGVDNPPPMRYNR